MTEHRADTLSPECIDPDVGRDRWRLQHDPELDDAGRAALRDHVAFCEACRLKNALEVRIVDALEADAADNVIRVPASRFTARRRMFGSLGSGALAAGLALMLLLPPRAPDAGLGRSGEAEQPFLRPVESEVIADRTPSLSWRDVEGASGFRLVIESADGAYVRETLVEGTRYEVPADDPLPADADLRAYLYTMPVDVGPPQGEAVAFRTGGALDVAAHRARTAPLFVQLLTGLGLASLAAFVLGPRRS
jgi:hypothetical protein